MADAPGKSARVTGAGGGGGARPRSIASQGGIVGGMTALSRLSGLLRDIVLSHALGASGAADTFFLAFRVPNFFRRLFAEGAFAQAFVPVLAQYREHGDAAATRRFVAAMAGNLGAVLLAVALAGVAAASVLVAVFMPGFLGDGAQFGLARDLTRIMFPYLALISLTAFAGAVLNSADRYAVPAFTPVLLNLSLIGAALWAVFAASGSAAPTAQSVAYALAWGVLLAGVLQLALQLPSLGRARMLVAPRPDWRDPGARRVGRLLIPAVFAASAGQLNALLGTVLASLLERGSASWLYYADRLMELPIGIVAIALGTVLLPNLSRLHEAGEARRFSAMLDWGMRAGVLLGVPAAAALAVLAFPLVATIFLHGEMTVRDAAMTRLALVAFAAGLVPLVLAKIAAPGYFARRDTRTPFKFAVASVAANAALSLATFLWIGHLGLALATSVAAFVNAALLIRGLLANGLYRPGRRLARVAAASGIGAAAMSLALHLAVPDDAFWIAAGIGMRIGALALAVLGGLAVYALVVLALGIRPADLRHRDGEESAGED